MKNFCRAIPDDVSAKKKEADTLRIFDNYVVLHYDPKGKSFAETEKEVEYRKDPILFGVIEGVRKLYFVGEWKDAECDLTMSEIESILGRDLMGISEDPSDDMEG